MKLNAPENFINRELSWLEFNNRVLEEALDNDNPLLERLKFLTIVSSNLDEFFMVRVGGLKQLVAAGSRKRCPAGLTPRQQLSEITRRVRAMVQRQYGCLLHDVLPQLARLNIVRVTPSMFDVPTAEAARRFFEDEVFPVLTPVAAEDDNFPRVAGLTLHLAVRLRPAGARSRLEVESESQAPDAGGHENDLLALIALPASLPRYFQLPADSGFRFILLEDLTAHFADRFFSGYEVIETTPFRLTRDADLTVEDDDAVDLMQAMTGILRERQTGRPVRLCIDAGASPAMAQRLSRAFAITVAEDLYRLEGPLDLKSFSGLVSRIDIEDLHYPPFTPQPPPAFADDEPVWDVLRRQDVLVHHPYESFEPVARLLQEAADDPQVTAIKQTLYRTSVQSPVIAALERAALKGKQVTVLVELKARFDEERNIGWARRLDEAGAQVIYGVAGYKTHSKILMIIRREPEGVRRYIHLATGNYNDITARLYEDIGLFTSDPDFGADGSNFFNAVTGYSEPREWRRLVIAPMDMRRRLEDLIDREIHRSSPEDPGLIQIKCNSLLDPGLASRLYKASRAGVRIEMCIRGICCLRPGVAGLSDNIRVISIVDRFLEHSRIFHFRNGGQDEVYLSSADWMPRNLDRRVEIMFPVLDERHKRRLIHVLEVLFSDNQRARRLLPDGTYERVRADGPRRRAQQTLLREAREAVEAERSRHAALLKPQGPGTAPGMA